MGGFLLGRPVRMLAAVLLVLAGLVLARYVARVGKPAPGTPVVVAFGDSLTEGGGAIAHPWPAVLAERLGRHGGASPIRVVNAGISGNRLLREDFGPSGLRRFEHDALGEPGVRWVIVLEGINDRGFAGSVEPGAGYRTA